VAAPPGRSGRGATAVSANITSAHTGRSKELRTREKRYAITMGFRTACFVAMIFVPGTLRWVLFACAVFLPYVAVVLANQAHVRGTHAVITPGAALDAPQLTVGPEPEVISVREDDDEREDRVA